MEYKITRAGWIYILGTLLVALAALNTGNNLLFLILACLISVILMSGILSSVCLSGVELHVEMPEHIFAGQPERATVELKNEKLTVPSFSLTVEAVMPKKSDAATAMLQSKVYFPYLPRQEALRQRVPVTFPQRGVYRQDTFRIVTRFPFGFLQKARRLELKKEVLVYPNVETVADFAEIFAGIDGALESMAKGRGQDLYALREYLPNDSARHVHWKASARLGNLMVREFTHEEDFRVLLVLDPHLPAGSEIPASQEIRNSRFERAVTLCAGLAWHFFERGTQLRPSSDPQLREDPVEVRADRPMRQEQSLADLAIGQTLGGELGDLKLLGGELNAGIARAGAECLARGAQLLPRAIAPAGGSQNVEELDRFAQGSA